jgi:hypothetical protein
MTYEERREPTTDNTHSDKQGTKTMRGDQEHNVHPSSWHDRVHA